MSSNLSAFLKPNVKQIENVKFIASKRFTDDKGKPVEWEIGCISAEEYAKIRNSSIRNVPVPGKRNQFTQQFDTTRFQSEVCAKCTVFPDLNDAELQNSWGVLSAPSLIAAMLIGGEFDDYVAKVFEINGFRSDEELTKEAKN